MADSSSVPAIDLELWGGLECTRNRVGDHFFDQFSWSGHADRPADLERIAALGIRTLRYPALWEWASPEEADRYEWSWIDDRLRRLKQLSFRPIVGLVHHGSGPRSTSLIDPSFAEGLAHYARAIAERHPWVAAYTPVNEPLTTARFSTLYGAWYPHARDSRTFATAILNQCRATVLAMRAIRSVRPDAQLVQTEDLGKTYSSPTLTYQADFDNARRWLTYDLLCGRVDRHHPVGSYFLWLGVPEGELIWFGDNQCPPDLVGINYYVTSERYLDEAVDRYPWLEVGGNGRHQYVDTEAVRVRPEGLTGITALLKETWSRYQRPIAVTEAHLGCSREEQLRWLWEIWQGALAAKEFGVDVRGVTSWSLLGAFDWDSLVTLPRGRYEPGAFDIRGATPRPTALAGLIQELANSRVPSHAVLQQPGWWRRPCRLNDASYREPEPEPAGAPILITGGGGTLAGAFARLCHARALPFRLLRRAELDIADPTSIQAALDQHQPWAVINAAGYMKVDGAELDPRRCWRENSEGPALLAAACARAGLPLMTFSSDLVFDGARRSPYCEGERVNPLNEFGRSKVEGERRVLALCPHALVIRTSPFFGPWDRLNFITRALENIAKGHSWAAADAVISPTYLPDLVHACLDLLVDRVAGIWHLAGDGETSWGEFVRHAAHRAGLDPNLVDVRSAQELGWRAERPTYSALGTHRGTALPAWDGALTRFLAARPQVRLDDAVAAPRERSAAINEPLPDAA